MRLIDTDAIPDKSYWCGDALSEAIETAPTIDAVPREKYDRLKENAEILAKACAEKEYVVRCKDCIHNGSYDTDCPITWSSKEYWSGKEYCSFGERGDADEN